MPTEEELRHLLRDKLDETIARVNSALTGKDLDALRELLHE